MATAFVVVAVGGRARTMAGTLPVDCPSFAASFGRSVGPLRVAGRPAGDGGFGRRSTTDLELVRTRGIRLSN